MSNINDLLRTRSLDRFGRPLADDVAEYQRIKAALNQEAKDNWHEPSWHREQAQILAQRLDYGFVFDSLFSTYFDVQNVGLTDIVTVSERRGMQVFWTARGGYIDETQLKTERWEVPRDTVGFHVSEFEDKLMANYAESVEDLANLAQMRLDAEVNRRMFNLLQTAVPSSSPYYVNSSGLTKEEVDSAIREVYDAVRPNNGVIPPVTIIGRATMIDKLSDIAVNVGNTFNPTASEELRRQGMIGTYRGANVVRIQNYADENDNSYIPEDEMWVFAGTVGKFVKYGGMRVKSWVENTSDYSHTRGRTEVGGLVAHPEYSRRVVDSSV